jgi:hypothetical protein
VFLLRALLAAQPLWRRGRAEVGGAIPATRPAAGRAEPAGTWSTKATTAWARTTEAAAPARGTGSPEASASATETAGPGGEAASRPRGWAIFASPSFAHGQIAALKRLGVELLDDLFGDRALDELDEGEATRAAGFPIDRHDNVGRLCDGREMGPEVSLTCPVREVSDEQTDCQDFLVKGDCLSIGARF